MRMNTADQNSSPFFYSSQKIRRHRRPRIQVYRLIRRTSKEKTGKEMKLKNLKLYLENQTIIEENKKLRKKASLLLQENLALLSEFQKKFPHPGRSSTTCKSAD